MKTKTTNKCNSKIREALVATTEMLEKIFESFPNVTSRVYISDVAEVIDNARAILAEPSRNCDVGTDEEQLKRFKDFCRIISKDETCDGCPLLQQCSTLEHCTLKWAQMPYLKGETVGSK